MVTVKYRGALVQKTEINLEELEASNVLDVLNHIKAAYGSKTYKEAKRMLITVNNESILLHNHFKTPLKDGDIVSFYPISGGG